MLSRQAIFNAYFSGPEAVISLIEDHLGQEALSPPPSVLALQHTVQGQLNEIRKLKRQINNLTSHLASFANRTFAYWGADTRLFIDQAQGKLYPLFL